jgi:hypothetical protein
MDETRGSCRWVLRETQKQGDEQVISALVLASEGAGVYENTNVAVCFLLLLEGSNRCTVSRLRLRCQPR